MFENNIHYKLSVVSSSAILEKMSILLWLSSMSYVKENKIHWTKKIMSRYLSKLREKKNNAKLLKQVEAERESKREKTKSAAPIFKVYAT